MANERYDSDPEGQEESEYHFSDDQVNYEMDDALKDGGVIAAAAPKVNLVEKLKQNRRLVVGVVVFIVLLTLVYKMLIPSATVPATDITQENLPTTVATTKSVVKPTPPAIVPVQPATPPAPVAAPTIVATQQPVAAPQQPPQPPVQQPVAQTAEIQQQSIASPPVNLASKSPSVRWRTDRSASLSISKRSPRKRSSSRRKAPRRSPSCSSTPTPIPPMSATPRRRAPPPSGRTEHVATSHAILPEIREFERASTTALNAYLQPVVGNYLNRLQGALKERDLVGDFHIVQSNGGVTSKFEGARKFPVRTAL